jgi:hypothetical protein
MTAKPLPAKVGDVITDFRIYLSKTDKVVRIRGKYVVEEIVKVPDGFAHGVDRYPGGYTLKVRRLNANDTYNPNGVEMFPKAYAYGSKGNNESFTVVKTMKRTVSFV